jgi:hypothetical protein
MLTNKHVSGERERGTSPAHAVMASTHSNNNRHLSGRRRERREVRGGGSRGKKPNANANHLLNFQVQRENRTPTRCDCIAYMMSAIHSDRVCLVRAYSLCRMPLQYAEPRPLSSERPWVRKSARKNSNGGCINREQFLQVSTHLGISV